MLSFPSDSSLKKTLDLGPNAPEVSMATATSRWHQAGNTSDLSSSLPVPQLSLLHLLPGPCKMVHKCRGMLRPTLEVGQHPKGLLF